MNEAIRAAYNLRLKNIQVHTKNSILEEIEIAFRLYLVAH